MSSTDSIRSLVDALRRRAAEQPERRAFTYLVDGENQEVDLTYAELDRQARSVAAYLQRQAKAGDRALLLYPSGPEFIAAYFGCLYAGIVAAPAYSLRMTRGATRILAMLEDCQPALVLTTAEECETVRDRFAEHAAAREIVLCSTDVLPDAASEWRDPGITPDTLAFLQYTSGSTSLPKGVMVTHRNLLHNCGIIQQGVGNTPDTRMVSWLPHYHDMGLIAAILEPVAVGFLSVLMPPERFVQRPVRWLNAIAKYGGTLAPAPNFAYDLCVRKVTPEQRDALDLRSWCVATNGAEPVRHETLNRFSEYFAPSGFRREAFVPCYGLAEATLAVSFSAQAGAPRVFTLEDEALGKNRVVGAPADAVNVRSLVGCGRVVAGMRAVIVDPDTRRECPSDRVGEIWLQGDSVAKGYWNRPEETGATFEARLAGSEEGPFLRTGDLGFLRDGELAITGRLKDIIIIRGFNYYPQDIELTAGAAHPALRPNGGAAFSIELDGEEKLVVVQEVDRRHAAHLDVDEVAKAVRSAISEEHELDVHAVVFVKQGAVPRTSSGKIQRHACRDGFLSATLDALGQSVLLPPEPASDRESRAPAARPGPLDYAAIRAFLVANIAARLGVAPQSVDVHQPFASLGLNSMAAVQLAADVEDFCARPCSPTMAYEHPCVDALARYLAEEVSGRSAARDAAGEGQLAAEPVAIIGMACRFPGAKDIGEFWRLLRDGVEAIREVPAERWDVNVAYDPNPATPGKMNTKWGGFLEDVDQFDAAFFGISPREAAVMDPQQRLLMEVSWEALEHANLAPDRLAGTRAGTFVGISSMDYLQLQIVHGAENDAYGATGNTPSVAANRLSYFYDFRGPSVALDTACSAGLVALHQACQSLQSRECDMALAGAVNLLLSPLSTISLSQARLMSSDGHCKAFDAAADGYVRSEGCGMVVLKRLADALADGDPILAVVRGTAFNHDGRSNGLTAPNTLAQQAVMRAAFERARVAPHDVDYLEAHGTGTPIGDPIEFESIKSVLLEGRPKNRPCVIGSVKTNIGHLEIAAGIAGLIKAVLALQHEEIPPHLHLNELNPMIHADGHPFVIPRERTPWPKGPRRRLAGVSAFGFGGANAHAVIEEAPARVSAPPQEFASNRPRHLLTLCARSGEALRALAGRYASFLEADPTVELADLCHAANTGRARLEHRLAVVSEPGDTAESGTAMRDRLAAFSLGDDSSAVITGYARRGETQRAAFLFTGQGAQFAGMGRQLYETEPTFRAALQRCSAILEEYLEQPLLSVMYPEDGASTLLDQTAYTQPALFALEYALAQMWMSWGVTPDVLLGHSVGEIAAACVAEAFTLEEGLRLIAERARLIQTLPPGGSMTAVFADHDTVCAVLEPYRGRLDVAAVNGPELHVISGERAAMDTARKQFEAQDVRTKPLTVSHAFHSPLIDPILDAFAAVANQITYRPLRIPLVSNRDGRLARPGETLDAAYWRDHVRNAVQFDAGMRTLAAEECSVFVEIGPANTLLAMGRRCVGIDDARWLPSLSKDPDNWRVVLLSLADAHVHGVPVDWQAFDGPYRRCPLHLPTYPFQRKRHWFKPGSAKASDYGLRTVMPAGGGNGHQSGALSLEERQAIGRLFYRIDWVEVERDVAAAVGAPSTWLILTDSGGVGQSVARHLEARGHTPVLVARSDADPVPNADYSVVPGSFEQINLMLHDLFASDRPSCQGILHLWNLDIPSGEDGEDGFAKGDIELGCGSALYIIQGLMRHPPSGSAPRLWMVTRGAQTLPDDPTAPALKQAPVWGLCRTVALESPELTGKLIDLDPGSVEDATAALTEELLCPDEENMVAFRGRKRFGARLARVEVPGEQNPFRCRPDGTYLLTGGLGGLGANVARRLVEQGARRLILMARTPIPARADWADVKPGTPVAERIAVIKALESQGASIHIACVDVGDAAALAAYLDAFAKEEWPPIRGVIHLAGTLHDQLLAKMDMASFDLVFHAKVRGAWHLHTLLDDAPLDFFVLFSSSASMLGAAGQGNYAAANAFLDALAHYRRLKGRPALSINWGPWAEAGMAARPDRGGRMAQQGMNSIDPEKGVAALGMLLGQDEPEVGVLDADWGKLAEVFWTVSNSPFLSSVRDGREQHQASDLVKKILKTSGDERKRHLLAHIRQSIAEVLRTDVQGVPQDQDLVNLGFDSIMVMDLIRNLSRDLRLRMHAREFFEQPNLEALADYITTEMDIHEQKRDADAPPEGGYLKASAERKRPGYRFPQRPERRNPPCVFLLAAPRSGSTLLRVMFSAHPGLFSPPELHILWFQDMRDWNVALGDSRYLGDGLQRAFMELRGYDTETCKAFLDELVASRTPIQDVYAMLQREAHPRLLVDKSPSYNGSLEILKYAEDLFDKPKYIYLSRHPYAAVESYKRNRTGRMFDFGHADPFLLAEEVWAAHNDNIMKSLQDIGPERQFRVRFEDLVRTPDPIMRDMCGFLGLPFDGAVLFPYEKGAMLDGALPNSKSTGDPNFMEHTSIDPRLGDVWKRITLPAPLGAFARRVAEALEYELPSDEAVAPISGVDQGLDEVVEERL